MARKGLPGQAEWSQLLIHSFTHSFIHSTVTGTRQLRNGPELLKSREGELGHRSQDPHPGHHSGLPPEFRASALRAPARNRPPAVAMATGSPGPVTPARALVARNSPGPHARLITLTNSRDTDPGLLGRRFKDLRGPEPTPTPSAAARVGPPEPRRLSSALLESPLLIGSSQLYAQPTLHTIGRNELGEARARETRLRRDN